MTRGQPQNCAPRYRTLLRMYFCLPTALCIAAAVWVLFFSRKTAAPWIIASAAGGAATVFLPGMLWERTLTTCRSGRLKLERGLIFRSITLVPREQIAGTRLRRGPLERLLGLHTVVVITTAGSVAVPGLEKEQAFRLRRWACGRMSTEEG